MSNATVFQPIAARPAPVRTDGFVAWSRANLFADWKTSLATVFIGSFLIWYGIQALSWGVLRAVWAPTADLCRVEGVGACWGVVTEKYRLIIFGRYPFEEQWRPLVATVLMLSLLVVSCIRYFWKP